MTARIGMLLELPFIFLKPELLARLEIRIGPRRINAEKQLVLKPIIIETGKCSINRGSWLSKQLLHDFSYYQIGKAKCRNLWDVP